MDQITFMIYLLSWNIEEKVYSCSGDYESLFRIYLSLKEIHKKVQTERDIYIQCVNSQGQFITLKGGFYPKLATKGEEKVLISKGSQNFRKYPV